jgi:preprotein translocase subunit YajC
VNATKVGRHGTRVRRALLPPHPGPDVASFLPVLLLIPLWFLLVRPQQKRVRAQQAMVLSLETGDEVITTGGIYGTIVELEGDVALLDVAPGVQLRVARQAVGRRLTPHADDLAPPRAFGAGGDRSDNDAEPDGPAADHPPSPDSP